MELIFWDIYEIHSSTSLQGVMLRGRLRKFANQHNENLLVENDENGVIVHFALFTNSDPFSIKNYILSIIPDAQVTCIQTAVPNPVLSKLKVNLDDRYTI